jgi:hypothetical protein
VDYRELARTGVLAAGLMTIAAIAFYGFGMATGSSVPFTHDATASDIWHLNYPLKHVYAEALREGRLPLWCPGIGTGLPLHAEGEVGALYPINLVLFFALPLPLAFDWAILIHVVLAGVFAALYARQVGASRGGALLAGLVFALAGFFVTHVKHTNMFAAAVWIPLLLFLQERHARGRSPGTVGVLAIVVALMLLAGHPQVAYNNLLIAGAYATVLAVGIARRKAAGGVREALRFGRGLAWGVLLGVVLSLPQLLPTYELTTHSPRRGGLSLEEATEWDYGFEHLWAFIRPAAFGDPGELDEVPVLDPESGRPVIDSRTGKPVSKLTGFDRDPDHPMLFWEMTGYVGLLPLALSVCGAVLGFRRPAVRALLLVLLLAVLLTLGRNGGLFYVFFRIVPGFDLFRFHSRFLLYIDLVLAVMAGLGLTLLVERIATPRRKAAGAALVSVALVVCFVDLFVHLGDHNPGIDPRRWSTPPPTALRILEADEGREPPSRIASSDAERVVFTNAYYRARGWKGDLSPYEPARMMLEPNLALLFGIDNIQLYHPNELYPSWMGDVSNLTYVALDPRVPPGTGPAKIASIFNVRFFIDPLDALSGRYPELADFAGDVRYAGGIPVESPPYRIRLHENPDVLPRAFLVPHARLARETEERSIASAREIVAPGFDPRAEVVLVEGSGGAGPVPDPPPGPPIEGAVSFAEYASRRVRLVVRAPRDCWLFLGDTWYPGWVATVDGEVKPIYRANIAGRAVHLPRGAREVVFTYAPRSLRVGTMAALLGVVLLGVTVALPHRRGRA